MQPVPAYTPPALPPVAPAPAEIPGPNEQGRTLALSALDPPIAPLDSILPLTSIHPLQHQPTAPRLISVALPLTPYPDPDHQSASHSLPTDAHTHAHNPRTGHSPPPSDAHSTGSLTVRPAFLNSQQSTLRPLRAGLLPTWRLAQAQQAEGRKSSWQETDSNTARPAGLPHWISNSGGVRQVDEVDAEMCVLCGRERGRSEVTIKQFQLGAGIAGLMAGVEGGGEEKEGEKDDGLGRWMVCKDTASCDAAVKQAFLDEDEQ
ncbi:uncharacterized protein MKK02DRAFT_41364 [Dioszegia hungarica]|uniref:Uncharacterized protein n=1 Tax=Dioszegia hungarica TaxID=4972 RepID=A0AA38LPA8_9TREE|nr:uncharacterized protein MKK02DRAFT_41364 [Dioszegia hungarica]KAI9631737.1 hypothetical protein MKK02DRAFT_41364 [Dioszegia hungarica]